MKQLLLFVAVIALVGSLAYYYYNKGVLELAAAKQLNLDTND